MYHSVPVLFCFSIFVSQFCGLYTLLFFFHFLSCFFVIYIIKMNFLNFKEFAIVIPYLCGFT